MLWPDQGICAEIYTVKKGGYKLSVEFSQSNFSVIFTQNFSCSDQGICVEIYTVKKKGGGGCKLSGIFTEWF